MGVCVYVCREWAKSEAKSPADSESPSCAEMAAHQAGQDSIVVRDLRTSGVLGTRDTYSKSDLCSVDQAPPSHLLSTRKPEFGK